MDNNIEKLSLEEELALSTKYRLQDSVDLIIRVFLAQISGGCSQLYNSTIPSPSEKRIHKFLHHLLDELNSLRLLAEDQMNLDSPSFETILRKAIEIATKNHQETKLSALRNAVINCSLSSCNADDDLQSVFLRWIDELTQSHLEVLRLIQNICNYTEEKQTINIEEELQKLGKEEDFYNFIIKDLDDRGLIKFDKCQISDNLLKHKLSKNTRTIKQPSITKQTINKDEISIILQNQHNLTNIIKEIINNTQFGKIDYILEMSKIYNINPNHLSNFLNITPVGEAFLQFISPPKI